MRLILDMGSGNTCKNDNAIIEKLIDSIPAPSNDIEIILKWQLFEKALPNIPLEHAAFEKAYWYAQYKGYKTTASVFDKSSLEFLLRFDVPFIKIACRKDKYPLADYIPRGKMLYISIDDPRYFKSQPNTQYLACIPNYPATRKDYLETFGRYSLRALSDHTPGLDLFREVSPEILEKHYVLKHDSANPDAGSFAVTPAELQEIL